MKKLLIVFFAVNCFSIMVAMNLPMPSGYTGQLSAPQREKLSPHESWKLGEAARAGNAAEVKRLISAGAKPQSRFHGRDYISKSLMDAINYGHTEICQLLVAAGADLSLRNKGGNYGYQDTPLILAARRGNRSICEFFVHHQEQITKEKETVLLCLNRLKKNGDECARLLYNHRKDLLFPYIGRYVPLTSWLRMQDHFGKNAYDYLPIDCLDSQKTLIRSIYAAPVFRILPTITGIGGTLILVHYAVRRRPVITGIFTGLTALYFYMAANSQ